MTAATDLTAWLAEFVDGIDQDQPYRTPSDVEVAVVIAGLWRLLGDGAAASALEPLGFTVAGDLDAVSGRSFRLAYSERPPGDRAWGAVLLDRFVAPRLTIGCPHPVSDRRTERVGLALWRATTDSLLLIAGAHRDAAGGFADPRDHPETLFHRLSVALLTARLPHLQVHGYADASAPGVDVVVSPGAGAVGPAHVRVADSLAAHGLVVGRAWEQPFPDLDGTTNIQGEAAAAVGSTFVHLELSATTRATRVGIVAPALAGADLGRY